MNSGAEAREVLFAFYSPSNEILLRGIQVVNPLKKGLKLLLLIDLEAQWHAQSLLAYTNADALDTLL